MTDIDIIRMAKEAGGDDWGIFKDFMPEIEKLFALAYAAGAAAEREACADLVSDLGDAEDDGEFFRVLKDAEAAIRARGQE